MATKKGNAKVKRALLPLIAGAAMCGSAASAADTIASNPAPISDAMLKSANLEPVSALNTLEFFATLIQDAPEPVMWVLLVVCMLIVGFAMRRPTSDSTVRVRYP